MEWNGVLLNILKGQKLQKNDINFRSKWYKLKIEISVRNQEMYYGNIIGSR